MADASQIQEHMDVVASDGQHIGTVDHVQGDHIKLTRADPAAGGQHHLIPTSIVAAVDTRVHLSQSVEQVRAMWQPA